MVDIFLYPGEPDPEDIRLGDPTQAGVGGLTILPFAVSSCSIAVLPDVILGALIIAPEAVIASADVRTPSIPSGAISVQPEPVIITAQSSNPTVLIGGAVPTPGGGIPTFSRPIRRPIPKQPVSVVPAPAVARAIAVGPEIVLGPLVIAPAPGPAEALAISPEIVLGPLQILPAPAMARMRASAPSVKLGTLAIVPAARWMRSGAGNLEVGISERPESWDDALIDELLCILT